MTPRAALTAQAQYPISHKRPDGRSLFSSTGVPFQAKETRQLVYSSHDPSIGRSSLFSPIRFFSAFMDSDRNDELAASKKAAEIFSACEEQPFTERVAGYEKIARLVPKDQHHRWVERLGIPSFDKPASNSIRGEDHTAGQASGSHKDSPVAPPGSNKDAAPNPGAGNDPLPPMKPSTFSTGWTMSYARLAVPSPAASVLLPSSTVTTFSGCVSGVEEPEIEPVEICSQIS
ncbi:hypothetical protein DFS34DRAFT_691346 [Phlyctochytrium arcticum]|nr:hypothetical protein DFS34DRAFT_691346 [Phlyctochytrium arcticum]